MLKISYPSASHHWILFLACVESVLARGQDYLSGKAKNQFEIGTGSDPAVERFWWKRGNREHTPFYFYVGTGRSVAKRRQL